MFPSLFITYIMYIMSWSKRSHVSIPGCFLCFLREALLLHQLLKVYNVLEIRNKPKTTKKYLLKVVFIELLISNANMGSAYTFNTYRVDCFSLTRSVNQASSYSLIYNSELIVNQHSSKFDSYMP